MEEEPGLEDLKVHHFFHRVFEAFVRLVVGRVVGHAKQRREGDGRRHQARYHQQSASPAERGDQSIVKQREDGDADAGAARRQSGGERQSLLEPDEQDVGGGDVGEAHAGADDHPDGEVQGVKNGAEDGGRRHPRRRQHRAQNAHLSTAVDADEAAGDRPDAVQKAGHDRRHRRGGRLRRVVESQQLRVQLSDRVEEAVGEEVDHEDGEHHYPAVAAVRYHSRRGLFGHANSNWNARLCVALKLAARTTHCCILREACAQLVNNSLIRES